MEIQTDDFLPLEICQQKRRVMAETQMDVEWLNDQIKQMAAQEKTLKRSCIDKRVYETDETGVPVNKTRRSSLLICLLRKIGQNKKKLK
jgi:hypothetical protein